MPVLTQVDLLGIQSYVFATNRLRDAVGGSALVERLADWVAAVCPPADVILAAGGNALLRFPGEPQARDAITRLSRQAHDEAPGLELVASHRSYESGRLVEALRLGREDLRRAREERLPGVPLLGLGVTQPCRETRLPAVAFDADGRPVAAGIIARRRPELSRRWDALLPTDGAPAPRWQFPLEMDHLGRTRDDRSLLGVVHVDGNGVGRKIGRWLAEQGQQGAADDAVLAGCRELSSGLNRLAQTALEDVLRGVVAAVDATPATGRPEISSRLPGRRFHLHAADGVVYLPVRPIILGGDDLTFVCDGRLALDLAAAALAAFERTAVPLLGRVHACAGVAIARTHAPILPVYELASELCDSAKQHVRERQQDASALDWHIGLTSPHATLDQIRRRQYGGAGRRLTCRPYRLGTAQEPGTWRWLSDVLLSDTDGLHGPAWAERRSKVRDLAELAREGPEAVAAALAAWAVTSPGVRLPPGLPADGYLPEGTPLLDAVELLDIHFPLARRSS
jgi:hypothetical protein